jgi:hypothetical protein
MKQLTFITFLFLVSCTKTTLTETAQIDSAAHLNGRESFPVAFITYDSCNQEEVLITANLEYKYQIVGTDDNLFATACYFYKDGRGVGLTSGNEYKMRSKTFSIERLTDAATTNVYNVRVRSKLTFQTKQGQDWTVEGTYRLSAEKDIVKTLVETETSFCK